MRLVIAGGGTGGHLFPGLALAEELQSRGGHQVLFMGARGGIEEQIVPQSGHKLEILPSLKGGFFSLSGPKKMWLASKGYMQARRTITAFKADAVVGTGGYASFLPVMAAWGLELPSMLLEQNVIPGRTNRFLSRLVSEVGVQFEEAAPYFPNPKKVRKTGNPLRGAVLQSARSIAKWNTSARAVSAEPALLVLGGSQGASALNELAVAVWPRLKQLVPGVKIILVAGKEGEHKARMLFDKAGVRGEVMGFCNGMAALYSKAEAVLARSGATTLAELSAFALPSVLIPYPHAADNHQEANARVYSDHGAAWTISQKDADPSRIAQRIADTMLQPERRRKMAMASAALAMPQAASAIADRLLRLCNAELRQGVDLLDTAAGLA